MKSAFVCCCLMLLYFVGSPIYAQGYLPEDAHIVLNVDSDLVHLDGNGILDQQIVLSWYANPDSPWWEGASAVPVKGYLLAIVNSSFYDTQVGASDTFTGGQDIFLYQAGNTPLFQEWKSGCPKKCGTQFNQCVKAGGGRGCAIAYWICCALNSSDVAPESVDALMNCDVMFNNCVAGCGGDPLCGLGCSIAYWTCKATEASSFSDESFLNPSFNTSSSGIVEFAIRDIGIEGARNCVFAVLFINAATGELIGEPGAEVIYSPRFKIP